jgi:hypothetical protein
VVVISFSSLILTAYLKKRSALTDQLAIDKLETMKDCVLQCIGALFTLLFLISITGYVSLLLSKEYPSCDLYVLATPVRLNGSWMNLTSSSEFPMRVRGCNLFVLCETTLHPNKTATELCRLGNEIAADQYHQPVLRQDQWLEKKVCADLNDYTPSYLDPHHEKESDEQAAVIDPDEAFNKQASLSSLLSLWQVYAVYLLVVFFDFFWISSRYRAGHNPKEDLSKGDKLFETIFDQIFSLFLLPVTILSPLSSPHLGCDEVITGLIPPSKGVDDLFLFVCLGPSLALYALYIALGLLCRKSESFSDYLDLVHKATVPKIFGWLGIGFYALNNFTNSLAAVLHSPHKLSRTVFLAVFGFNPPPPLCPSHSSSLSCTPSVSSSSWSGFSQFS